MGFLGRRVPDPLNPLPEELLLPSTLDIVLPHLFLFGERFLWWKKKNGLCLLDLVQSHHLREEVIM